MKVFRVIGWAVLGFYVVAWAIGFAMVGWGLWGIVKLVTAQ